MKIIMLLVFGCLLLSSVPVHAAGSLTSPLPVQKDGSSGEKQLTPSDDVLSGESASRTYTYTMLADETPGPNRFIAIDWTHSELLIPPSALTIEIDGEPVQSIALTRTTRNDDVQLPLQGQHLTKGTHEVTVRFTGIVRGRMCDTGKTAGSWLTILPSSALSVGDSTNSLSLSSYPNPYSQTLNTPLTVVIPNDADAASLEAGLLMYRELKQVAADPANVSLQYERQLDEFDGRYVFVGQVDSFSGDVATLVEQIDVTVADDEVLFEVATLENEDASTDALFVLARDSIAFEGTIDHLFNQKQRLQLSGERLVLSGTSTEQPVSDTITLSTLGVSDLLLNQNQSVSQNYFYPLPVLDNTSALEIDLRYKASSGAHQTPESQPNVELIAWVNGVPHAVPIATNEKTGWMNHKITIDSAALNQAAFLDLSFEATGLRDGAPCTDSDASRWLYISEDSQITLPKASGEPSNKAFMNMANIFSEENGVVLIVPGDLDASALTSVANVISGLPTTPHTGQLEVIRASDVKTAHLKERSVIFIGDPETIPVLGERKEDWLVTRDGEVDLAQYGFIPETTEEYAWIQPSLWNEDRTMIVFSTVDSIDASFMQTLTSPSETFSVAVKNQNGSVFTNSDDVSSETIAAGITSEQPVSRSNWYMVGFITLIFSIAFVLLIMRRRTK